MTSSRVRPVLLVIILVWILASVGCRTWTRTEQTAALAFNRANSLRDEGRPDEAVTEYRRALVYQPDMAAASFNLALTLADTGGADEAADILDELLVLDPENLRILKARAWVALQDGNPDEAEGFYHRVLQVFEADGEALKGLVDLYRTKADIAGAVEVQRSVLSYSDTPENHGILARLLDSAGAAQSALDEYRYVFAFDRGTGEDYLAAGRLAEALDLFREASGYYLSAGEAGGDGEGEAWFHLARIRLVEFQDYLSGYQALEAAGEAGFDDADAYTDLLETVNPEIVPDVKNLITSQEHP